MAITVKIKRRHTMGCTNARRKLIPIPGNWPCRCTKTPRLELRDGTDILRLSIGNPLGALQRVIEWLEGRTPDSRKWIAEHCPDLVTRASAAVFTEAIRLQSATIRPGGNSDWVICGYRQNPSGFWETIALPGSFESKDDATNYAKSLGAGNIGYDTRHEGTTVTVGESATSL